MKGSATPAKGDRQGPGEPPAPLPGFEAIKRYWDRQHKTYAAKILPGEYYVTRHQEMVVTVLGSCVSACIRDRGLGIGGMNHFMLPVSKEYHKGHGSWGVSASARYGNFAMEALINAILKQGGSRKNLEVKIFGGGKILTNMTNIGRLNIAFVRDYIDTEGLRLTAEDVGDLYPRRVHYFPMSGKVWMKRLRTLHNDTIVQREMAYLHDIESKPVGGEVELF